MKPYYQDGCVTIYNCDCREILPALPDFDLLLTDPPWGLGSLSGTTSKKRNKNAYLSFVDSEDYITNIVVPIVNLALSKSKGRGLVFSGVRCMWLYPRPRAVGGFYQPAAVGMSPWGFAGYNPVLFYGKDPRDGKGQSSVMTTLTDRPDTKQHPCAKPMKAMFWAVNKGSIEGETIVDPFAGTCTTGRAAKDMKRKCICIEMEERYCELGAKRMSQDILDI